METSQQKKKKKMQKKEEKTKVCTGAVQNNARAGSRPTKREFAPTTTISNSIL
jgi:hypothetical protein